MYTSKGPANDNPRRNLARNIITSLFLTTQVDKDSACLKPQ